MAKGKVRFLRVYRTYNYIDKNPVIDKIRTIVDDEGLMKSLNIVHEISGVATTTLKNWFDGDTKNPQHHTIAAVITALGYEERFVKTEKIDIDAERAKAQRWYKAQEAKRQAATAKK